MKTDIVEKLIQRFRKDGAREFRSILKNSKSPQKLAFKGNRKMFMPDLVVIYQNKRDLISVESKIVKSQLPDLIAKWILFGLEARRYGGNFYLVVAEKNSKKCREIIQSKQLSAEILTY